MKALIRPSLICSMALSLLSQCAHEYEFTDDAPRQTITQVSPMCGRTGDTITITGEHFEAIAAKNTVTFNGNRAAVLLASSTYLTALVPARTTTGNVSVAIGSTEATGPSFTYLPTGVVTVATDDLSSIDGLAADGQKNIYMVRPAINRVDRRSSTGALSMVAGGGRADNTAGFSDGFGPFALFNYPADAAIDSKGNIYISDTGNHCIRKISADGYVSLYAGYFNNQYLSPQPGYIDGLRTEAYFDSPQGIFIDKQDKLYICDTGNRRIRVITPDNGNDLGRVTTLAGTGALGGNDGPAAQATFNALRDLVVDDAGNVYIAEAYEDARIRKITTGRVVSTIMRGPDKTYSGCDNERFTLAAVYGIALDTDGNIYCSVYAGSTDSYLSYRYKIITIAPDNTISTLAGGGDANGPREGIGNKVYFPFCKNLLLLDNALYMATDYQLTRTELN